MQALVDALKSAAEEAERWNGDGEGFRLVEDRVRACEELLEAAKQANDTELLQLRERMEELEAELRLFQRASTREEPRLPTHNAANDDDTAKPNSGKKTKKKRRFIDADVDDVDGSGGKPSEESETDGDDGGKEGETPTESDDEGASRSKEKKRSGVPASDESASNKKARSDDVDGIREAFAARLAKPGISARVPDGCDCSRTVLMKFFATHGLADVDAIMDVAGDETCRAFLGNERQQQKTSPPPRLLQLYNFLARK